VSVNELTKTDNHLDPFGRLLLSSDFDDVHCSGMQASQGFIEYFG